MSVPKETLWEIEPHTKAKHEILKRYLNAWFPILSRWNSRIIYLDGFCGPGRYKGGEPGSPLIALEVAKKHRQAISGELKFFFIDESEKRILHLHQELDNFEIPEHFTVEAETKKFREELSKILDSLDRKGTNLEPTFAFIDPFGFSGIPFTLIKRFLKHKKCETLITFMVDAMNRFIEHPNSETVQHIVEVFGTEKVKEIEKSSGDRIEELRTLYQKQLSGIAKFVRHFELKDKNDRRQYYLFFVTNHKLGHIKMKEAMWKVDPEGEFSFSDATDPNQTLLFEFDSSEPLALELRSQFQGKEKILIKEVHVFVENETAFLKKHMIQALKKEEGDGRISVDPIKTNGKKRKAGTFPDDALITFI